MIKMPASEPLSEYHKKRDLRRTTEPDGDNEEDIKHAPIFVIQKHAATRLHYDFRLEADGVLKSWAVPKGPSTNPKQMRLAVPTEDHPIDYAQFEGTISKGQYGGGTVMVWDTGTYEDLRAEKEGIPMYESLAQGKVEFRLHGKKLKGAYALVRTKMRGKDQWLLIKKKDGTENADVDILNEKPDSALTGRTMEEIANND